MHERIKNLDNYSKESSGCRNEFIDYRLKNDYGLVLTSNVVAATSNDYRLKKLNL